MENSSIVVDVVLGNTVVCFKLLEVSLKACIESRHVRDTIHVGNLHLIEDSMSIGNAYGFFFF